MLARAMSMAAPAGLVIWLLAHYRCRRDEPFGPYGRVPLTPEGKFMGLDGVILTAFILGLPANEVVLPIAMMIYKARVA